jgi:hypothetical protein
MKPRNNYMLKTAMGRKLCSSLIVITSQRQVHGKCGTNVSHLVSKVTIDQISASRLAADVKHFPLVPNSHKPNVDRTFLRQLMAILRIAFPSWRSKELLMILLHSSFLVLRTVLSIAVARLDGRIVRDIVSLSLYSKDDVLNPW